MAIMEPPTTPGEKGRPNRAERVALTDPHVRALRPRATAFDVWDAQQRGLLVRVLPSGRIEFAIRYRIGGSRRRLKLGCYPAVSLKAARSRARSAQSAIDNGKDPAAERQAAKTAPADTVKALADDYLKKHARKFKRSAAEDERLLEADVLPTWGPRSVRSLTRRDVRLLLDRVVDRGSPIMANRLLAVVRKMLNFAVDHDWIEANPAARVAKPAREVSRERVLTDEEIRRIWRVLEHAPTTAERPAPGRKGAKGPANDPICPVSPGLAAALKIRLLTAQRGGETIRMKWADVDLDAGWWEIPGTDTKNGEPHRVPLVARAQAIIRAQQKEKKEEKEESEFVFVGRGASLLDRAKKAPAAIARVLTVDFRGHDLRRTAATRMAAAGIPRDHIAKVLNHVEGGARATRVYDRHTYADEKRMALEAWDRALTAILTKQPKTGAAVVPIRRRQPR
ncbi:MAG: integrase family protein [Acidobacteria bacterium]|nr:integrase family protein [Acidobacteriota bacterium]